MINAAVTIDSKLHSVGTTIFTVMSKLASDCGAINLAQGFADFQADPALFATTLAAKVHSLYGARYDEDQEITVTAGATQAIFTAIPTGLGGLSRRSRRPRRALLFCPAGGDAGRGGREPAADLICFRSEK